MKHRESGGTRELLRIALSMAARGWHVFPCAPGRKQPALTANWQEIATTDPARIGNWWRRIPFNIGIACGRSGLVVLDLDVPGHGTGSAGAAITTGASELEKLCLEHSEPYPDGTLTVRTPSGGLHLIFAAPDTPVPNSAGKLAPRVDVRGDGGYIVGYGSHTGDGRYEVIRPLIPAPLPEWIAALARRPDPPAGRPPGPRREIADGSAYGQAALDREAEVVANAPAGTRNDTLFKAARSLGQLVAGGVLSAADVRAALAEAAEKAGLAQPEYARTIASGLKSGARMPRGRPWPIPRCEAGLATHEGNEANG